MNKKGQAWTVAIIISAVLGVILIVIYWPSIYAAIIGFPQPTALEVVKRDCAAFCAQWRGGGCPYQDWNTWLVESDCIGKVDYMNKSYWCGSEPNLTDMGFGDCEKTEILSPNVKYERIVHYECPCRLI